MRYLIFMIPLIMNVANAQEYELYQFVGSPGYSISESDNYNAEVLYGGSLLAYSQSDNTKNFSGMIYPESVPTGIEIGDNTIGKASIAYPNPSSERVHFNVNSDFEQRADIQIVDNLGNIMFKLNSKVLKQGENIIQLDVDNLSPGTYTVRIICKSMIQYIRFIKH